MSKKKFSDQLRHLIETSGQSRNSIAEETGIDKATLSRFMAGKGGLSIEGLDELAKCLNWTVQSKPISGRNLNRRTQFRKDG